MQAPPSHASLWSAATRVLLPEKNLCKDRKTGSAPIGEAGR